MKNKNFVKLMLLILILSLLFVIIRTTYSKYVSSQDNSAKLGISKWHILVNDQNILENGDFTETLEVEFDQNEHVAQNVIVPTSTGHFDVELESTGTEKVFEYILKFVDEDSDLPDFKIISYTLNGNSEIEIETDQTEITGIVEPATDGSGNFTGNQVINSFHFNIAWYDEADNILDNYADVAVSKKDVPTATIPLELSIIQLEDDVKYYKIEYYYDGVKDASKTDIIKSSESATITQTDIQNKIDFNEGDYEFSSTTGLPLTVSTDNADNLIKVYYVTP